MAYLVPLNSSAFLSSANQSLRESTNQIAISTSRLSSGNRLVRAGDDVAALSISTRMVGELAALRQAQQNITQGSSMLQIAYESLSEIGDILDRMKSLSTQANSGSLTATERSLLQTEFSALGEEITRIAGSTTFNDVNLLDGSLSGANNVTTTTTDATKASASVVFASITTGETVVLNGVTLTADTQFAVGGSLSATIDNLVNYLNNTATNTALTGATYARSGNDTLTITQKTGGTAGNLYYINDTGSTADLSVSGGTSTALAGTYTLSGGLDNGLGFGSVSAVGTIGDALVTTQSQTQATSTIAFSSNALATETITIDDGNGSNVTFQFVASASTSTEITIGSDIEETIANAIEKMSEYSGSSDYGLRQLEFERDGTNLIIRSRLPSDPLDLVGAALNVGETITGATISTTTLNSGTNTGVNVNGVMNGDFVGNIQGFSATYNSADNITASITVGDSTYTATISDTTPASATTARFKSTDGGYFDVEIAALGASVADQDDADTFASRLNAAFDSLTFYQQRNISSFSGTGDLAGASARIKLDDYTTQTPQIDDITVSASTGSGANAIIEIDIDGEIFRSGDISDTLGAGETVIFTSTTDINRTVELTLGNVDIDLSNATDAATFEEDLRDSFGLNSTGSGSQFQVGSSSTDKITVNIGAATFTQLFGGVTPSVDTQENAETASTLITTAKNTVTSIIANVGALQSRFDIASNVVDSHITGLDAARASLADTDIVEESTIFAQAQLKNSAGIAILAQAQRLQSGLLDLLQAA